MPERTLVCAQCGGSFLTADHRKGRKFCSSACFKDSLKRRMTSSCEVCGLEFTRKISDYTRRDGNTGGRFCSKKCQGVWTSLQPRKPKPPPIPKSRVWFPECKVCGKVFCGRAATAKVCSAQCKIDDAGFRVKGLYAAATQFIDGRYVGAQWRRTLLQYLVDRDGDKCGICGRKVDISLKSGTRGSRRGPSVDHIVPRSLGGSDDLENLRLAHWGCNQKRSNRGGGEQLALVG